MSSPKVPAAQAIQQPPNMQDATVSNAAQQSQRRNRAAAGSQSTILTPGSDTSNTPLMSKTLLGQ